MKKITKFFMFAILIAATSFFTSCKDPVPVLTNMDYSILGTWENENDPEVYFQFKSDRVHFTVGTPALYINFPASYTRDETYLYIDIDDVEDYVLYGESINNATEEQIALIKNSINYTTFKNTFKKIRYTLSDSELQIGSYNLTKVTKK